MEVASGRRERGLVQVRVPSARLHPYFANTIVNLFVSAGFYEEAIRVPESRLASADPPVVEQLRLVEINRSEAEYNLGRWQAAEDRLRLDEAEPEVSPLVRTGRRLQLAWIAAHRGRAQEALSWCEGTGPTDFPREYRAELHFPRAAALLGLGRLDEAQDALRQGMALAMRPASERNGLFLLARVEAARGRLAEAEALARAGAEHRWRGQGGDGLLLWGDLLGRLGREEEARAAWRLTQARDPQSESAAAAGARLERLPG